MTVVPSANMLVDRVDLADQTIGVVRRGEIPSLQANFRVVHLLIFNRSGEVLLQQLSSMRDRHPLRWGASVAAYVATGESYEDALRRRSMQELGAVPSGIDFVGKFAMPDLGGLKFVGVFVGTSDGPFVPDAGQIANLRFVTPESLAREVSTSVDRFTPTFIEILKAFPALLK